MYQLSAYFPPPSQIETAKVKDKLILNGATPGRIRLGRRILALFFGWSVSVGFNGILVSVNPLVQPYPYPV